MFFPNSYSNIVPKVVSQFLARTMPPLLEHGMAQEKMDAETQIFVKAKHQATYFDSKLQQLQRQQQVRDNDFTSYTKNRSVHHRFRDRRRHQGRKNTTTTFKDMTNSKCLISSSSKSKSQSQVSSCNDSIPKENAFGPFKSFKCYSSGATIDTK